MLQLFMRKDDLDNLPSQMLPEGISLITHQAGMEKDWESLIEASFGSRYDFEKMLKNWKGYEPENVFYLVKNGKFLATASGVENEGFANEGWLHMVGSSPDARGMGLGKIVTLAVLHSLKKRGFKSVVLSTDDYRIPAIITYLKLGFKPIYIDDTHEKRWENIMKQINII